MVTASRILFDCITVQRWRTSH